MVLGFTFSSMRHFEFIYLYDWGMNQFFAQGYSQQFQSCLLNRRCFLHCVFPPLSEVHCQVWIYFWTIYSIPLIFFGGGVCITLIPRSPNYCNFILNLEIRSCLCCSTSLEFSLWMVQSACHFLPKNPETLIRIMLNLGIKMGSLIFDILFVIVTIW